MRLVSADMSNWLIAAVRETSRGFESQAEMVFPPKALEILDTLV